MIQCVDRVDETEARLGVISLFVDLLGGTVDDLFHLVGLQCIFPVFGDNQTRHGCHFGGGHGGSRFPAVSVPDGVALCIKDGNRTQAEIGVIPTGLVSGS